MASKGTIKSQLSKRLGGLIEGMGSKPEIGLGQVPDVLLEGAPLENNSPNKTAQAMPAAQRAQSQAKAVPARPHVFNPFDLSGEEDEGASVSIGNSAKGALDRAEFVRQIEQRLDNHRIELKTSDKTPARQATPAPAPQAKPFDWHDIAKPVNSKTKPVRNDGGLSDDLRALQRLRKLSEGNQTQPPVAKPVKPVQAKQAKPPESAAKKPAQLNSIQSFLQTPTHLELESKAQADLAGFFMDEFQLLSFKDRVLKEKQKQVPLE
ncbi:MAG: hypothetical protein R3194_13425, partial [Limnobacter sp.]|nr:hypothetical protein [Limnobacter sp.]